VPVLCTVMCLEQAASLCVSDSSARSDLWTIPGGIGHQTLEP